MSGLRHVFARYVPLWLSCSVSLLGCNGSQPPAAHSDAGSAGATGTQPARSTTAASQRAPDAGRPAAISGNAANPDTGRAGVGGSSGAGASTPSTMAKPSTMAMSNAGTGGMNNSAGTQADAGPHDSGMSPQADCGRCTAYGAPMQSGSVAPGELSALSGVAVSRVQPDVLFAHNDHDRPVVYALDQQGRLHARVTLQGAQTNDIEDIALGKCDAQTCVYLADVGDNAATRGEYSILRFVEPEVPSAAGAMELMPKFEQLKFRYEDGSHNAESLMVAPDGTLYIITKLAPGSGGNVEATGPSDVFRIAGDAFHQTSVATAQKVTTLSVPQRGEPALSAAAAHPCGLGFLVRTYDRVYEFLVPPGAAFEGAFAATPTVVAMPDESQSEGIDYLANGRGFVTSGEGAGAPILVTQCAP